jgi:hypothetical protein
VVRRISGFICGVLRIDAFAPSLKGARLFSCADIFS